jgi:hypothetical protein
LTIRFAQLPGELVAPPSERWVGFALLPLAPLLRRSRLAGMHGRPPAVTVPEIGDLPVALLQTAAGGGAAARSCLQLEVRTCSAD